MVATDNRSAAIKEYARDCDTMDDAKANRLAERYLALDSERLALRERYYKKFKKALGAKTAARFIQLEDRMNLLADHNWLQTYPSWNRDWVSPRPTAALRRFSWLSWRTAEVARDENTQAEKWTRSRRERGLAAAASAAAASCVVK